MLVERREMAKHVVASAFDEQLLGAKSPLLETLLKQAPYAITWDKIHLYGEDIRGLGGKENKDTQLRSTGTHLMSPNRLSPTFCLLLLPGASLRL